MPIGLVPGSGYNIGLGAYEGTGVFIYQGLIISPQVVVLAFRNTVWDNPYSSTVDTDGQEPVG